MRVPALIVRFAGVADQHKTNAGLYQAPPQQDALAEARGAVAIAPPIRLPAQVEGLVASRGAEQVVGSVPVVLKATVRRRPLLVGIELFEQSAALMQPACGNLRRKQQARNVEILLAWVRADKERIVGRAEETRVLARVDDALVDQRARA